MWNLCEPCFKENLYFANIQMCIQKRQKKYYFLSFHLRNRKIKRTTDQKQAEEEDKRKYRADTNK